MAKAQTEILDIPLAIGETKTIQQVGAQFEVLSVSPFGLPLRIRADNGDWGIYAAGEGDRPQGGFTKLEIVNDVFPALGSQIVQVRLLITRTTRISRIVRIRDLEVFSGGFGLVNIANGGNFTFDLFAAFPNIANYFPDDWTLMLRRVILTMVS
jgi:hypothetical protein